MYKDDIAFLVDGIAVEKSDFSKYVTASDRLNEIFDSIDVTAGLLGKRKPIGWFYTMSYSSLERDIYSEASISLTGDEDTVIHVEVPAYIWMNSSNLNRIEYLSIKCTSKGEIRYPVELITVSYKITEPFGAEIVSSTLFYSEEELIDILDEVLNNL